MKKIAAIAAAIMLVLGTTAACSPTDDDQAMKKGPGCCET